MRRMRWWMPIVVVLLLGSACSSSSSSATAAGSSSAAASSSGDCATTQSDAAGVAATEKDFAIALDPGTASAGDVTFSIANDGPSTHEFVVFRTDLEEDELPLVKDGSAVDEEGEGVTHVDEVEDIAACSGATLTVKLDPGSYVVLCNIPGHYGLGMHATLTVA